MKIKYMYLMFMAGMLTLSAAFTACSDDEEVYGPVSSRVTLTLGGFPGPNGGMVTPVWKAGDRARMFAIGAGENTPAMAEPILTGSVSGDFLFTVNGYRDIPNTMVAVYPADAQVECSDGRIVYDIPTVQDGTPEGILAAWTTAVPNSFEGIDLKLKPIYTTLSIPVERGNYIVSKVDVRADGGENISGKVSVDPTDGTVTADGSQTVSVNYVNGLDCTAKAQTAVAMIAPVSLSAGYTVTVTMTDGQTISIDNESPVELRPGEIISASSMSTHEDTRIAFCGSDMIYIIKPFGIKDSYRDAIEWQFDAKALAQVLGIKENRCNHIDDCKPVDAGRKMLVTSSYNWSVLLDIQSKEVLFHTNVSTNAHSAELLPGNRIAVACSSGGDAVQIYDMDKPDRVLWSQPLVSAHGVVWMESKQRLYAIGGETMYVYKLVDWNTDAPRLECERTFKARQGGLHDLTFVDDNTLCVSGRKSYLYNVNDESWVELTRLSASTALKSVNYNSETREMWFTDATVPEGTQTWSTHTLHYTDDPMGGTDFMTVRCSDIDIYKVRVVSW